ncbi:hypothetical protein [Nostoc sp. C117]|uniref:hypothetical protein n=1 Tax=Nostoc sp. C117 TaxID=3349875 RepID=UPI00370D7CDD
MSQNQLRKNSVKHDPFVHKLFTNIPPETAAKFTNTQLTELKRVLTNRVAKYHAVDIRLSIPFLKQRFYVVLLIGKERVLKNASEYKIFTQRNSVLFVASFLLTIISLINAFNILKNASTNEKHLDHQIQALQQLFHNKL